LAQAADVCLLSVGKCGVTPEWLYVDGCHPGFVVWHEAHAVGNPVCGTGVVADVNAAVWHA
jgi:hypothetical protein